MKHESEYSSAKVLIEYIAMKLRPYIRYEITCLAEMLLIDLR